MPAGVRLVRGVIAVVVVASACGGPVVREDVPTDLMLAVQAGSIRDVRSLLANGADPDEHTLHRPPPLNWAVNEGDAAMTEVLLDGGASPESPVGDRSYLTRAAESAARTPAWRQGEYVKVVRLLVDAGADPCVVDSKGDFVGQRASSIARGRGLMELSAVLAQLEQNCPPV